MEDDHDTIIIGIGEDIFIKLHHRLFVATKEINLDTKNAIFLHPFHLLTALIGIVHNALGRLGRIVPTAITIVPQIETHAP